MGLGSGKWRWCHSYKRLCRGGVGFGEMELVSQLQGVLRMCRGGVGFREMEVVSQLQKVV